MLEDRRRTALRQSALLLLGGLPTSRQNSKIGYAILAMERVTTRGPRNSAGGGRMAQERWTARCGWAVGRNCCEEVDLLVGQDMSG